MRWNMVLFRVLARPALVLVVGMTVATLFGRLDSTLASRIALVAAAVAAAFIATAWYQLWSWTRGRAPGCRYCDGPLGLERPGKVYYGKQLADYRSCYSCGRNTPA